MFRFSMGLVIAGMLVFASVVNADLWSEVGDAGDLPGTAQVTIGGGESWIRLQGRSAIPQMLICSKSL